MVELAASQANDNRALPCDRAAVYRKLLNQAGANGAQRSGAKSLSRYQRPDLLTTQTKRLRRLF